MALGENKHLPTSSPDRNLAGKFKVWELGLRVCMSEGMGLSLRFTVA